jgi:hypothetical protein
LVKLHAPGSCSFAVHVALEEAGQADEACPTNLAVNSLGKVPALAVGDEVIPDNIALNLDMSCYAAWSEHYRRVVSRPSVAKVLAQETA